MTIQQQGKLQLENGQGLVTINKTFTPSCVVLMNYEGDISDDSGILSSRIIKDTEGAPPVINFFSSNNEDNNSIAFTVSEEIIEG